MIITENIRVRLNGRLYEYYHNLGYDVKGKKYLDVSVNHLNNGSKNKIEVCCDICFMKKETTYKNYMRRVDFDGKYYCRENKCFIDKVKLSTLQKYGVDNTSKLKSFQDKWKATNLERYGVENIFQHEDSKIKIREKNGWLSDHDLFGYQKYSRIVRRLTLRNKAKLIESWDGYDYYDGEYIIDNFSLDHNDPNYPCIDHKISIKNGYLEGISEEVLSSIDNLCFTKKYINSKKKTLNYTDFMV